MIPDALTSFAALGGTFLQADSTVEDFPAPLGFFLAFASVAMFATISVIVWQVATTYRAKMSVAREDAYTELAHKSTLAMERTANRLDEHSSTLTALQTRVAEIERMLKEVD